MIFLSCCMLDADLRVNREKILAAPGHEISKYLLQFVPPTEMDLTVRFSNGVVSPQIFLGTYRIKSEAEVETAVSAALSLGYRGLDTASVYRNHNKIATTLAEVLPRLGLSRPDIFITSKLAPLDHGTDKCRAAIEKILRDLNTDYLDLFLIHWPGVQKLDVQDPMNRKLRLESWRVLEECYRRGVLRSIGVSNYTTRHLTELLGHCEVVPHVLQTELHPHYQQRSLVQLCDKNKIHVQAYSSLGQAGPQGPLFSSPVVTEICKSLGKSPAQILLKWGLMNGYTVMPKSVHPERIKENVDLNFTFEEKHLNLLNGLELEISEKYTWNPESIL